MYTALPLQTSSLHLEILPSVLKNDTHLLKENMLAGKKNILILQRMTCLSDSVRTIA